MKANKNKKFIFNQSRKKNSSTSITGIKIGGYPFGKKDSNAGTVIENRRNSHQNKVHYASQGT